MRGKQREKQGLDCCSICVELIQTNLVACANHMVTVLLDQKVRRNFWGLNALFEVEWVVVKTVQTA